MIGGSKNGDADKGDDDDDDDDWSSVCKLQLSSSRCGWTSTDVVGGVTRKVEVDFLALCRRWALGVSKCGSGYG